MLNRCPFDGNVSLSLKSIMIICAINTALMDGSKAKHSVSGFKVKVYILHKHKKHTVSESKEIVTAPDRTVSSGECEAK